MSTLRKWYIYKIVNPKGSVYIGRTCNFKRRLYEYKSCTCNHKGIITNSIKKYGFENHTFEIIDSFESDLKYANGKEMFWIRTYCSNRHKFLKNGMNCTDGGGGSAGVSMPEEIRNKISETKRKNPRKLTDEEKKRVSERMKGHKYTKSKPATPEWIEKMRKINTGKRHPNRKRPSRESIEATAAKNRGKKRYGKALEAIRSGRAKVAVPIMQYDLQGNLIADFNFIKDAAKELGVSESSIGRVLNGKKRSAKGWVFKYKNKDNVDFIGMTDEEKLKKKLLHKQWYEKNKDVFKAKMREKYHLNKIKI